MAPPPAGTRRAGRGGWLLLLGSCCLLALVASTCSSSSSSSSGDRTNAVFHVSPHGSAGGDGSAENPWVALEQAQLGVRSFLRTHGDVANVTVAIAAGKYFNTSLVLTAADSPGASSGGRGRVWWQGPTGAGSGANAATLFGGVRITGWRRSAESSPVWQAALPAHLLDADGRAAFSMLVQDERSAVLARAPNFGSGYLQCPQDNTGLGPCLASPATDWQATGKLPPYLDCANSSCSVFTRAGYSSDIRPVTHVNGTTGRISMQHAGFDAAQGGPLGSSGSTYLQGALELLDQEGEWAVRHGQIYFWPYSAYGRATHPDDVIVTAPARQRVISFVGESAAQPVHGLTIAGLRIVGSSMPPHNSYVFSCSSDPPTSPGADCAEDGGPSSFSQCNNSPKSASQGMIYLENATAIEIRECALRAAGIAGIWLQESNSGHVVSNNWVQDIGGFGLYANGVVVGDRRYSSPTEANCNHGHTITGLSLSLCLSASLSLCLCLSLPLSLSFTATRSQGMSSSTGVDRSCMAPEYGSIRLRTLLSRTTSSRDFRETASARTAFCLNGRLTLTASSGTGKRVFQ